MLGYRSQADGKIGPGTGRVWSCRMVMDPRLRVRVLTWVEERSVPWKPRSLNGVIVDWGGSLRHPFEGAVNSDRSRVGGDLDRDLSLSAQIQEGESGRRWENGSQDQAIVRSPASEDDDDPTTWSVLGLMTAIRGWIGRQGSARPRRPMLGPRGEDILRDLKAADMESRIPIHYFMSDINLELRHQPDHASYNWLSIPPRTTVFWRGQIGYDEDTGQPWYLVYKIFRGELYSGYVPASYLRAATARPLQESPISTPQTTTLPLETPSIQEELLQVWRKLLTDQERQAYYQPWFQWQSELESMLGLNLPKGFNGQQQIPVHDLPASWALELDELLYPAWLRMGDPPPDFYGQVGAYPITDAICRTLQNVILYLYEVEGPISVETWEIIGAAFGIPAADAFLQVLHPGIWSSEYPATTESGLPLQMSVLPASGVYLRPQPGVVMNLKAAPFNGLPQGEEVIVSGGYHLQQGSDGMLNALLAVEYVYHNGQTYRGWVPAEYLGVRLVSLSPQAHLWEGPFNTFGYHGGVEPWRAMGYHTYGQAQFLNLQAIFRNLGWEQTKDFPERHLNLCGQLASMESMNVSLEEGMRVFASIKSRLHILQDPTLGTTAEDLRRFIQALGWQAEIHFGTDNLEPYLGGHQVVLALVASEHGRLTRHGTSGHWVHILDLDRSRGRVSFYNPMFNQVQELAWAEFNAAWGATGEAGITNVDRIFVTAQP